MIWSVSLFPGTVFLCQRHKIRLLYHEFIRNLGNREGYGSDQIGNAKLIIHLANF